MKEKSLFYLLCHFLLVLPFVLKAIPAEQELNNNLFDTLKTLPSEQLENVARTLYEEQLTASKDSSYVFEQLNKLRTYAFQIGDRVLANRALVFRSDYYWNYTENGREQAIAMLRSALDESKKDGPEWRVIELYNRLGIKLLLANNYKEGFTCMLQSERMIEALDGKKMEGFNAGLCLLNIGWAYSWFFNHERAIDYYKRALNLVNDDTSITVFIYNSMGIAYQETKRNDSALVFYQRALRLAKYLEDSTYLGLISANLGWIYQLKGQAEKARPALELAMPLMRDMNCWQCMANVAMNLAYTDLLEGKLDSALIRAAYARNLLETKPISDQLVVFSEYYDVLAKVHKRRGELSRSNAYMDSLIAIKDSIHYKKNTNMLANLEAQLTAEQYLAQLEAVELEKKKEQLLRNSIIVLSLLLLLIFYQVYSKRVLRKRKDLEVNLVIKEKEIELKKKEIQRTKEQLNDYTRKLREKSTLIDQLQQGVETLYPEYADNDNVIKQRKILQERLLSSNILTEKDWTEFKSIFERVHDGFFARTLNNYPELTIAEVRYIALTKLGLSPNEMANMLGISPDSVKRSIRRLRTKINVNSALQFDELVKGL